MHVASLYNFEDKHEGQKCFMVGAGPSLTYEMLDAIDGHVNFSMNNIAKAFPHTTWRPWYYLNVTMSASYNDYWMELAKEATREAKHSFFWARNFHIPLSAKAKSFSFLSCASLPIWPHDPTEWVSRYGSSMFTALQLAVFMKCNPIYLIGCDVNYAGSVDLETGEDSAHFDKDYLGEERVKRIIEDRGEVMVRDETRIIDSHRLAHLRAREQMITIKTCSPGPTQGIYPYISFEEALNEVLPA